PARAAPELAATEAAKAPALRESQGKAEAVVGRRVGWAKLGSAARPLEPAGGPARERPAAAGARRGPRLAAVGAAAGPRLVEAPPGAKEGPVAAPELAGAHPADPVEVHPADRGGGADPAA